MAQLTVLDPDGGVLCTVPAEGATTLRALKERLEASTGVPQREQQLFAGAREAGKPLDRRFSLDDCLGADLVSGDSPSVVLVRLTEDMIVERDKRLAAEKVSEEGLLRIAAGTSLSKLGPPHTSDPKVALAAVKRNINELQYASHSLRNDASFMISAAHVRPIAVEYAMPELWSNKDFVHGVVGIDGLLLRRASAEIRDNRDVVLRAVVTHGLALEFASEGLRNDRDVVLTSIEQRGTALAYASPTLKEDHDLVLKAVRSNPMAVVHCASHLRKDADIMAAVDRERADTEGLAEMEMQRRMKEQFLKADSNKDGTIDAGELGTILKALDKTTWTTARVLRLLEHMDVNHDGRVSYNEFVDWLYNGRGDSAPSVSKAAENFANLED